VNHCYQDPSLISFAQAFVIFAQAPRTPEPSEGAFDDPTFGQDDKSILLRFGDDFQMDAVTPKSFTQISHPLI
jgi:hypothetical protein